jgi:acetyl esterase
MARAAVIQATSAHSRHLQLDRETAALLHWVSSATPAPPLWSLPVDAARREYGRIQAKTEIDPPTIGSVQDLRITGPGGPLSLRRYLPGAPSDEPSPAILFVHGGGCVLGDVETHDVLCRTLCHDTRAMVLSLDYRLAPEHPFPAAVEDTVAALTWLSHQGSHHGADPARIAIAGDSAGAGLAAVALHETKGALSHPVRAQALIYPAMDLRGRQPSRRQLAQQFPIPAELLHWFFHHYFGLAWPLTDPRAMPRLYPDYSGLPPALILTAGHDPLRDEGTEYGRMLGGGGVAVDYECVEGTIHGFMNMGRVLRTAHRHGRRRLAEFLMRHLQLDA